MILFKQTDKKFIRMATRGDRNLSTRILNIIISLVETREIIIFSILVERFLSPLVSHQINSLYSIHYLELLDITKGATRIGTRLYEQK